MRKATGIWMGLRARAMATTVLALWGVGGGILSAQGARQEKEKIVATEKGFYCNVKALTAEERARLKIMTEKLMAKRTELVETEKGYEFQYSAAEVSVAEVAEWVTLESKCCPFFDFHIDLEKEGRLVCLRLTGREGIKAFIRAEFAVR